MHLRHLFSVLCLYFMVLLHLGFLEFLLIIFKQFNLRFKSLYLLITRINLKKHLRLSLLLGINFTNINTISPNLTTQTYIPDNTYNEEETNTSTSDDHIDPQMMRNYA